MAKIGSFDAGSGIQPVFGGREEIGRANLPASARLIPESAAPDAEGVSSLVYGRLSNSALAEQLGAYASPDISHRELLDPSVFFEALGEAAEAFVAEAGGSKNPGGGASAEAANALARILGDRELCQVLRRLVLPS